MSDETENLESEAGDAADDWAAALAEQDEAESASDDSNIAGGAVQAAPLQQLEDEGSAVGDEDVNLDVILDIPVTIAMEIGRTTVKTAPSSARRRCRRCAAECCSTGFGRAGFARSRTNPRAALLFPAAV